MCMCDELDSVVKRQGESSVLGESQGQDATETPWYATSTIFGAWAQPLSAGPSSAARVRAHGLLSGPPMCSGRGHAAPFVYPHRSQEWSSSYNQTSYTLFRRSRYHKCS